MRQLILVAVTIMAAGTAGAVPAGGVRPSLAEELATLKIPPDWVATTPIHWDMNRPWKDGRLEVRRLLAGTPQQVREGMKITWLYSQKGDIGDGHELPMYAFMSGNYAWATVEYPKYLARAAEKGPTHAYACYASSLAHFGEYDQAMAVLKRAMEDLPPPPWTIRNRAAVHEQMGDIFAQMGQVEDARRHYEEAMRLLPTSNQPYGRHLLHRQVGKIKTKLDLMVLQNLDLSKLKDGVYVGKSLGYADTKEMEIAVTLRAGRIADVKVKHEEKIDLNATTIVPQRIIDKQTIKVDGVTGATVTSQAIIDGAFAALKKAAAN